MLRATTTERSRAMKRTRNGILIPDVPIMAGGNLPNVVKGVSAGVGDNPLLTPFYIDVLSTLSLDNSNLQISDDAKNWQICGSRTLNQGRYYFRGEQTTGKVTIGITSQNQYNVGGNIMSLISYTWEEATLYNDCFNETFKNAKVVDASALLLPATTLANGCYWGMFSGCTSLTTAPSLPATTLANNCYQDMFSGCTSLTTAPALPATTLAERCYQGMFAGCTSLTTAPSLPATTLANACYQAMFVGCTSLTAAPSLPATTLENACYLHMFVGCTSLTAAPALPATTLASSCYWGMFNDCSSLTAAPALPATTLVIGCYLEMFQNCSSLSQIKCYAVTIASGSVDQWVDGVSSVGNFVKKRGVEWPTGISGIPTGWTVEEID